MPTPDQIHPKRFDQLLASFLDESIGEAELEEFAELIITNPEFTTELRSQLQLDNILCEFKTNSKSAGQFQKRLIAAIEAEGDVDAFTKKVVADWKRNNQRSSSSKLPWAIAVTSVAASIAILIVQKNTAQSPAPPPLGEVNNAEPKPKIIDKGVAVVSGKVGLKQRNLHVGDTIAPGLFTVKDGVVELEFYHGARVTVAGPAKLELVSSDRVICHYGKIRAQVPEMAKGFTVVSPTSEVVDLGTEFALDVDSFGKTEVHVIDGLVEAYNKNRDPKSKKSLSTGEALVIQQDKQWHEKTTDEALFARTGNLRELKENAASAQFESWQKINLKTRQDPRVIAYYDFQSDPDDLRILTNVADQSPGVDGAIVGSTWTDGPWPGKQALSFKSPGDRVRINLPGEFESLTFAAWLKVDGLDRPFSALLLSDGFDPGEVHWQIWQNGGIRASIRHPRHTPMSQFITPSVFNLKTFGRWFHLALVIDSKNETVTHYLNGTPTRKLNLQHPQRLKIGNACIGNWEKPVKNNTHIIRNLNGAMAELMIFDAALSAEEIQTLNHPSQITL